MAEGILHSILRYSFGLILFWINDLTLVKNVMWIIQFLFTALVSWCFGAYMEDWGKSSCPPSTLVNKWTHFLQIFNEINARRPEKFNIFEGIHKNYLFLGVIIVTIILQVGQVHFISTDMHSTLQDILVMITSFEIPVSLEEMHLKTYVWDFNVLAVHYCAISEQIRGNSQVVWQVVGHMHCNRLYEVRKRCAK